MGAAADRAALLAVLGVEIDAVLLETALTHRSYAYEHGTADNERLEFLGDSVLGRAVTAMLYATHEDEDEGALAKRRAGLVSTVALASIARTLGLGTFLLLGRGEVLTRGAEKPSILADAVESLIGATFLSAGSEAAEALVLRLVQPLVDDPASTGAITDPKTALQEEAARRGAPPPAYELAGEGPEHARVFTATVTVADVTATGTGTSKKQAEVAAAWEAYRALRA
ncbi:ribonuclease III [uncultured Amnibacterium sp.]|uniref:ribonuclease III n=1 Tax=uncultured Amnibacterium sp. TaxID=1631851 RepID=UPI0035CC55D0